MRKSCPYGIASTRFSHLTLALLFLTLSLYSQDAPSSPMKLANEDLINRVTAGVKGLDRSGKAIEAERTSLATYRENLRKALEVVQGTLPPEPAGIAAIEDRGAEIVEEQSKIHTAYLDAYRNRKKQLDDGLANLASQEELIKTLVAKLEDAEARAQALQPFLLEAQSRLASVPVTPWQMLIADGALLLGAIFLRPAADRPPATTSRRPLLVAAVLTLAAFGTSFGVPGRTVVAPPVDGNGGQTPPPPMAGGCPPLPGPPALNAMYWPIYDRDWVGECWTQTELAPHAPPLPKGFEKGTWYVLFYRKDCEHCHELMARFFTGALSIPTVAIAVPEPEGFPDDFDDLGMPCTECVQRALPVGPNYVMSTPVLVRVEDGIVQCAAEVDSKADLPDCVLLSAP